MADFAYNGNFVCTSSTFVVLILAKWERNPSLEQGEFR